MSVVGVTGHQNIPDEALEFIEQGIRQAICRFGTAFVGVSSLAAGADQLFAKTVLRSGGSLHVVIPCHEYEIAFSNDGSVQSYRCLLEQADFVQMLEYDRPSEDAYLAAGHRVVEMSDVLIAVWDGLEARGKGGTGEIVRYAREQGRELLIVWPHGVVR